MCEESKLISVVVPVYNAQQFLRETVESVLAQTYQNFELLLVDDCSTDHSLDLAREYEAADPRIRVISKAQNSGVADARNRGVAEAAGCCIALLDSDDTWERDKLELQMKLLEESKAQIVYCSYDFMDAESHPINKAFLVPAKTDFDKMLVKSVISCSTALIDAKLLKAHPMRSDFAHEDYVLWMELLSEKGVAAAGIQQVLAHYRLSSGSRSSNKFQCALGRWKIYRDALGMGILRSTWSFIRYTVNGIFKYYF